jgi:hypothetical protein
MPPPASRTTDHSGALVALAAFCMAGGGQFVNQQDGKGAVLAALFLSCLAVGVLVDHSVLLGAAALWTLALIDAMLIGRRIESGAPPTPWEWGFWQVLQPEHPRDRLSHTTKSPGVDEEE